MHFPLSKEAGSFSISYHLPRYCRTRRSISTVKFKWVWTDVFNCIYLLKVEAGLDLRSRTGTPVIGLSWRQREKQEEKVHNTHDSFGEKMGGWTNGGRAEVEGTRLLRDDGLLEEDEMKIRQDLVSVTVLFCELMLRNLSTVCPLNRKFQTETSLNLQTNRPDRNKPTRSTAAAPISAELIVSCGSY